jgi:K+-sensing histidine kinase KdpD
MMTGAAGQSAPAADDEGYRPTALEGVSSLDAAPSMAKGPAGPWWPVLRGLARQAARATEADRGRAALLAAVSHDLRAPLAAAKAAVSGLRLRHARLNALRYSLAASPPLVTARPRVDRVELRVVDHGPGIPKADWKRVFLPFHRLGDLGDRTGVGLGLVVSRGLTEAMGGTVKPEETPGGGLTMVVSLPQALANGAPGSCTYQACLRQRP